MFTENKYKNGYKIVLNHISTPQNLPMVKCISFSKFFYVYT